MANLQELKVSERDTTITPRHLRTAGYIPATVYGRGMQSQSVQVRAHQFHQLFLHGSREFHLSGFISGPAKLKNLNADPVSQQPIALEFQMDTGETGKKATKKGRAASKQG